MKTIINKLFFGVLYFVVGYIGFKGLLVNYFGRNTVESTVVDFRPEEIRKYNTVSLKEGFGIDRVSYLHHDDGVQMDIVYPFLSRDEKERYEKGKPVVVKVFVKQEDVGTDCLEDGCLPDEWLQVSGVCYKASSELEADIVERYNAENLSVDKEAIIVNITEKPRSVFWNLLMFACVLLSFTILKSFFPKSKGLKDWYNKVTHKEEEEGVVA